MKENETSSRSRSHRTDEYVEEVLNLVHSDRHLSITQPYYVEILKQLCDAVPSKPSELRPYDCILHHGNAPAHKMLSAKPFLAQKSITEKEHPPYIPYLVPNDFFLFPKIKSALNGRRFQESEGVQKDVTTALKAVPHQELQKCFKQWQHRGAKCVAAQVEYFEGDLS
jgi:hypothetical protein